jgi:hypothetical protein
MSQGRSGSCGEEQNLATVANRNRAVEPIAVPQASIQTKFPPVTMNFCAPYKGLFVYLLKSLYLGLITTFLLKGEYKKKVHSCTYIIQPWRMRQNISSKRWYPPTRLHNAKTQRTTYNSRRQKDLQNFIRQQELGTGWTHFHGGCNMRPHPHSDVLRKTPQFEWWTWERIPQKHEGEVEETSGFDNMTVATYCWSLRRGNSGVIEVKETKLHYFDCIEFDDLDESSLQHQ